MRSIQLSLNHITAARQRAVRLSLPRTVPDRLIDDRQLRPSLVLSLLSWIEPGLSTAGCRVLGVADLIPDKLADV